MLYRGVLRRLVSRGKVTAKCALALEMKFTESQLLELLHGSSSPDDTVADEVRGIALEEELQISDEQVERYMRSLHSY
jgi:hypothetical protein